MEEAHQPVVATPPETPLKALSGSSLARAASWVWGGHLVGQAAWFSSLIILGALLPPKSFGSVAIGLVIANAAALVQDAGSRGTIVLTRRLRRSDIARVVMINLAVGVAVAAAVAVVAGSIVRHFAFGGDVLVLQVLVLSVVVRALAIAPMAVLQRTMQFKLQASVLATSMLVAAAASTVAALLGAGVWALVVRQLASAALLPILAWIVALKPIRAELRAPARERGPSRRKGATWFFLLAATDFVALSTDSIVVGHSRGAAQLGLYSLAFTLAFAPLTNFAWQVGKVVFPSAAQTAELELIVMRMLRVTRLTATILLPLLPPTLVLAPVLLPGILGERWKPMVVPFQILVCVGIGHSILVALGDSLSGIGAIGWRARLHTLWALTMVGALIVLVRAYGITGAALAHLALFFPFAFAYLRWGTRYLQTSGAMLLRALREVGLAVGGQLLVTAAGFLLFERLTSPLEAAAAAGAAGLAVLIVTIARFTPTLAGECSALVRAVAGRSRSEA
jgi:O-antigen/teichoic acid export membrane protein